MPNLWRRRRPLSYEAGGRQTAPGFGLETTVHHEPSKVVLIRNRTGVGIDWTRLDLYDYLYLETRGTPDQVALEATITCPRCGGLGRILGEKKKMSVEYLDPPRVIRSPFDGSPHQIVVLVSCEEPLLCVGDSPAGKGLCGFRFRLQGNVIFQA